MPHIRLENVSFSFPIRLSEGIKPTRGGARPDERLRTDWLGRTRRFDVLRDLTLSFETGDRVGILGRNGSGKSTLLRLLHGIYLPESGTIDIDGTTDALFELNIGTRPQATGYENIIVGGLMRGYTREEIDERMEQIIEFADIGDFLYLPMSTYSAGMRARLLFSLATSFDPEILLLDEWVSAGDADFKEKAKMRMNEHVEKAGILILASHSKTLLRAACTKALWLEQGKVVEFGPLEEVLQRFDGEEGDLSAPGKSAQERRRERVEMRMRLEAEARVRLQMEKEEQAKAAMEGVKDSDGTA